MIGSSARDPLIRVMRWTVVAFCASVFLWGCATEAKMKRAKEASAHYKLGLSYLNDDVTQQAYVEFQKSIELNPNDRDSHYALGHLYFLQRKYDDAERSFKKVLKVDPDYAQAHNYLGKVYEQKNDTESAIRHFKKALDNPIYPTPDLSHFNLGLVYQKMGKTEDAIMAYRRAVLINPGHLLAHFSLGQLYAQEGKYQKAIDSYQEILRAVPESADARYQLAWAYLRGNNRAKAMSEFSGVAAQVPDSDLGRRSKKHLSFLESKIERLKSGMTGDQVMGVLGKVDPIVRTPGPVQGEEQWLLNRYDMVLRFESGRFVGYLESPR